VALAFAASMLIDPSKAALAASPQTAQADAALRYLYAHQGTDGSIAGSAGATEDTVISVADNGFDPATLRNASSGVSAYDFLDAQRTSIHTAGAAAKYVLTWLAAGSPAALHGHSELVRLNTPAASGGFLEPNGAFFNADPALETANSFSQSLAVLADLAAGHAVPVHATGWLACAQRPDGGFGYAITAASAAPPAFCGDAASDTNDTAIILQALGRAGVTAVAPAARTYLHAAQLQTGDGGFGFTAAGPSDPSSDTGVIQALVAIGDDPMGAAWTLSAGHDPVIDLESFADPQGSGGYVFPGNLAPDAFTTSQVAQALVLKPYGAATTFPPGSSPLTGGATPSPSPTSSVSAATGLPVPATGAADPATGFAGIALLALTGLGVVAGALTAIRRRRSPGS